MSTTLTNFDQYAQQAARTIGGAAYGAVRSLCEGLTRFAGLKKSDLPANKRAQWLQEAALAACETKEGREAVAFVFATLKANSIGVALKRWAGAKSKSPQAGAKITVLITFEDGETEERELTVKSSHGGVTAVTLG